MFAHLPAELKLTAVILSICALTLLRVWLIQRLFSHAIAAIEPKLRPDQTRLRFIRRLVCSGIYILGFSAALTQISEFQIIGHSLLAGAGIEDITLRETILRDFENNRIVVPNALISSQVLVNANHTDERICEVIEVGVGYSADAERAMAIMVEEILRHPLHIDNRTAEQKENGDPQVIARVIGLGSSSVNLRAWAWAKTPADGFVMQCDLLQIIKQRLDAEEIEIPFPQTTISFAKNELPPLPQMTGKAQPDQEPVVP